MSSLLKQQDCLKTAISIGNADNKFIETTKATRAVGQYCSIRSDMRRDMHDIKVLFDQNALPKLGSVTCVESGMTATLPGKHII